MGVASLAVWTSSPFMALMYGVMLFVERMGHWVCGSTLSWEYAHMSLLLLYFIIFSLHGVDNVRL